MGSSGLSWDLFLGGIITIVLLGLLVIRELASASPNREWKQISDFLVIPIIPLLVLFFILAGYRALLMLELLPAPVGREPEVSELVISPTNTATPIGPVVIDANLSPRATATPSHTPTSTGTPTTTPSPTASLTSSPTSTSTHTATLLPPTATNTPQPPSPTLLPPSPTNTPRPKDTSAPPPTETPQPRQPEPTQEPTEEERPKPKPTKKPPKPKPTKKPADTPTQAPEETERTPGRPTPTPAPN